MNRVPIHSQDGIREYALVNHRDYPLVRRYRWFNDGFGYAVAHTPGRHGKMIKMHRLILGLYEQPKGDVRILVDHINRNKMDNRRKNLRFCNQSQNSHNTRLSKNNTSGYRGVTWDKARGKWCAQIMRNRKHIYGGRFDNLEDAVKAAQELSRQHFEDFTPL